jgi:hypothetical protein
MITRLVRTIQVVVLLCGGSRALVLENLALRQQLGMHQRSRPKPAVRRTDRWFWVGLCRLWVANARRATVAGQGWDTDAPVSQLCPRQKQAYFCVWDAVGQCPKPCPRHFP